MSRDVLNTAIVTINEYIVAISKGSVDSFSVADLEHIIGTSASSVPMKSILLGLMQTKRLDIRCINGAKIYKLKF
jgi:hypothetical protein